MRSSVEGAGAHFGQNWKLRLERKSIRGCGRRYRDSVDCENVKTLALRYIQVLGHGNVAAKCRLGANENPQKCTLIYRMR